MMTYKYGDRLEEHTAPCGCVVIIRMEEWSGLVGDVVENVEITHHCKTHDQTLESEDA